MYEVGGTSLTSASGLENLINQFTTLERQPIQRLAAQKDELTVRRAIYDDFKSNLEALRTAVQGLRGDSSIFGRTAVTSSDTDILAASGDNDLAATSYDVNINNLAQIHRVTSTQQAQSDEALGLSGTFILGGAANRAVANATTVTNTVTGFSTAGTIREGESELGSQRYSVEIRKEGSWQFRLVDENGDAVRIASAKDSTFSVYSSGWQDLNDVAGTTFDTGRGLQIDFGNGSYTAGLANDGAATIDYTAQGATITLDTEDTLNDVRDLINEATFATGNEVTASVVNRTLVLAGSRTGNSARIELADDSSTILASLGFFDRTAIDSENLATDNGASRFATGALATFTSGDLSGQAELAADRYHVEIGSGANANKFRLLDSNGDVVSIANTSGGTDSTSGDYWLDINDGIYDTGRGLTITFQGGSYTTTAFGQDTASTYYDPNRATQSPRNALLTVNGLEISRPANAGLNDVIDNLSLDLKTTGQAQVSIGNDNEAVVDNMKTVIGAMNDLLGFIKTKTDASVDAEASALSDNPVYSRGALTGDRGLTRLRRELAGDMFTQFADAADNAPKDLADLGITLSENGLSFEFSNKGALTSALDRDFQAVADLLDNVLGRIENRLNPYLDGDNGAVTVTQNGIDRKIEEIDSRVESAESRLKSKEDALRRQFQAFQTQIFEWQQQGQQVQAFVYGSLLNQQG